MNCCAPTSVTFAAATTAPSSRSAARAAKTAASPIESALVELLERYLDSRATRFPATVKRRSSPGGGFAAWPSAAPPLGRRRSGRRAVDQDGNVLDILVQPRRDAKAAKRFFRKLLKRQCASPRVLVTDKLRSYQVARRAVMPSVEHRQSRYLNNRAENSHQPTGNANAP